MSVDYAALANTIKIEDITSNAVNRDILYRLKNNDETFDKLYIMHPHRDQDHDDYVPEGEDMGWLGYFVGNNTKLQELHFYETIDGESFFKELSCNTSIRKLHINGIDIINGKLIFMLGIFLQNNQNLIEIRIEDCELNEAGARQLPLTIGNCSKSLQTFEFIDNQMEGGNIVDIITALSMHPQLRKLSLSACMDVEIGINECTALSTLLRCTTTQLETLKLNGNNINNEGVEILVNALTKSRDLQELELRMNRSITIKGWKAVSTLLELPCCKLERLEISYNNIGDKGALVFANALSNNNTLTVLGLHDNGITVDGWTPFLNLLCDTSTVNNTHLSNHTLQSVSRISGRLNAVPDEVFNNLALNSSEDKQQVAITKILQNHSHFDMQPFFEWELKVLPLTISWFKRASDCTAYRQQIKMMRLSVTYDFIKAFPMLYIEPVTKQEIAECSGKEEATVKAGSQGMGDEQEIRLKEIRRCKARAMRRLGMK